MTAAPALLSSGVDAVDTRWGGLAPGAAYALVGRADDGRLGLAFHAVRAAVEAGRRCLLVSPRETGALVEAARAVGLDLAAAHGDGRLRLLKMPAAEALAARGDSGLAAAYGDLARLVETDRPDRVVVEDFTPLVQFETFAHFETAFGTLVAALAGMDTTLVVGLGEPANEASARLLEAVQARAAGTVQITGEGGDRRLVLHDGPAAPEPAPAEPTASEPVALEPVATEPVALEPAPELLDSEPASAAPAPPDPTDAPSSQPLPLHSGDGVPMTAVTPPPAADPALATAAADPFGQDAADFLAQGFLVDSGAGAIVGHVPVAPAPPFESPTGAPGWAPLGGAPEPADPLSGPTGDRARFAAGLDAAYASGTPFDAVAVRMDPASPAALHFETVVGGLRAALAPADSLFMDADRRRAVVQLAGQGRAAELFAGVQAHVRARLGPDAAAVLGAVAAAPIPGGAPFTSGEALLAYAVDQ